MKKDIEFSLKIGKRIRELRLQRGITQEKLGEISGMDPKHIQLMEGSRPSNSRVDTIRNIAEAFGLSVAEFFADDLFEKEHQEKKASKKKKASAYLTAKSSGNLRKTLFEDNLSYAIYDANPVNRGHLIILPKRELSDYFSALPEEKQSLWEMVAKAKEFLEREYRPDGYNIGFNVGAVAGQTEVQFCIHVIPRYQHDTRDPRGGVRGVIPEKRKP
ncbi:MAG TPA: HIT domain-containing protein [Leptospiraceae bacterium]|nr:HIT domain-containing protein [Leptospiraceae bacterium]HMY65883.1 HIT domain-containing protein [Leptospiraceae bacterium]HMZ58546.1 HIT domain-containing protein [Leptospiraceae bacterium]HNF14242.1 HIT domain-containing protein [Leptospiraceae bacterium]HNF24646.1 HIT domain-containing protein [Leptospiraceae bacterium]